MFPTWLLLGFVAFALVWWLLGPTGWAALALVARRPALLLPAAFVFAVQLALLAAPESLGTPLVEARSGSETLAAFSVSHLVSIAARVAALAWLACLLGWSIDTSRVPFLRALLRATALTVASWAAVLAVLSLFLIANAYSSEVAEALVAPCALGISWLAMRAAPLLSWIWKEPESRTLLGILDDAQRVYDFDPWPWRVSAGVGLLVAGLLTVVWIDTPGWHSIATGLHAKSVLELQVGVDWLDAIARVVELEPGLVAKEVATAAALGLSTLFLTGYAVIGRRTRERREREGTTRPAAERPHADTALLALGLVLGIGGPSTLGVQQLGFAASVGIGPDTILLAQTCGLAALAVAAVVLVGRARRAGSWPFAHEVTASRRPEEAFVLAAVAAGAGTGLYFGALLTGLALALSFLVLLPTAATIIIRRPEWSIRVRLLALVGLVAACQGAAEVAASFGHALAGRPRDVLVAARALSIAVLVVASLFAALAEVRRARRPRG